MRRSSSGFAESNCIPRRAWRCAPRPYSRAGRVRRGAFSFRRRLHGPGGIAETSRERAGLSPTSSQTWANSAQTSPVLHHRRGRAGGRGVSRFVSALSARPLCGRAAYASAGAYLNGATATPFATSNRPPSTRVRLPAWLCCLSAATKRSRRRRSRTIATARDVTNLNTYYGRLAARGWGAKRCPRWGPAWWTCRCRTATTHLRWIPECGDRPGARRGPGLTM
jgi:hypothetical protein